MPSLAQQMLVECQGREPAYYTSDTNMCGAIDLAMRKMGAVSRWAEEMPSLLRYLPFDGDGRGDGGTGACCGTSWKRAKN